MTWKVDRDALIAQTLAFVQSVTGKDDVPQPKREAPASPVHPATAAAEPVRIELAPAKPAAPSRSPPSSQHIAALRAEMHTRIASFRKHQERFEREREEYCAATLRRLQASLRDAQGPLPRE